MRDRAYHYELVRPGMAVYGLNPLPEQPNPMRAVAALDTRLLQIRRVKKGETVGYGATHTFDKDSTTGTVALGYADGFLRSGTNRAVLYHNGKPCPVLGRVSMDLVTVDLGQTSAAPGERLEILGPRQDADALAKSLGTIGYEILTSLGPRWARRYIG
jgi:alanine racemase